MQITSINSNASARKYTEGSTFGVSQIENIMSTAYNDASLTAGSYGPVTQGIYTINWTVTDSDPVINVKKINVRVTWVTRGSNKSFTADYTRQYDKI